MQGCACIKNLAKKPLIERQQPKYLYLSMVNLFFIYNG